MVEYMAISNRSTEVLLLEPIVGLFLKGVVLTNFCFGGWLNPVRVSSHTPLKDVML